MKIPEVDYIIKDNSCRRISISCEECVIGCFLTKESEKTDDLCQHEVVKIFAKFIKYLELNK